LTNRENDIELVDSLGASLLQGFLALGAAGKSIRGESFTEILNWKLCIPSSFGNEC